MSDMLPVPVSDRPTTRALYRDLWTYAAGARGLLLLASAMLVASQLVKLAVPWCAAQAIDLLQKAPSGTGLMACLPWVAAIIGLSVATWLLHGPGRVIERGVAVRVRKALTDALYTRLSHAPLAWHEAQHSAELSHRMTQASSALSNFTQSQFIYLQNAVNLIGPLVALALLSRWTGTLAAVGLVAVGFTIVAFDRVLMKLAVQENTAERRHGAALLDCLTHVTTVLSLRLTGSTRRLVASRLDAAMEPLKRSIALNEWKWCAVDLLSVALTWSLVIVYAWQVDVAGGLLLGGVFMVHQYAQQAGGVIGSLAANLQNFARIRADYASAAPIWNAPKIVDIDRSVPGDKVTGWKRLAVRDVHYRHRVAEGETAPPGLQGVSLELHAGERVALVGASGCGKSTLLRLLAGLYPAQRGHAEIDSVVDFGLRPVAGLATLIPQEAQVFEATVRENIGFDLGHADDALRRAAHVATFDAVLATLPRGLDSDIAQGGANLSGGQRQRLCLARGVLAAQGSSLLLLDEPTSALDPVSENQVFERLDAAFPDACIVASVHRMSLLSHFDRVVLMSEGRIVDMGTADALWSRQPAFRAMVGERPAMAA